MRDPSCNDLSKETTSMKFSRYPARIILALMTLTAIVVLGAVANAGNPAYRTIYRFQGGTDGWEPFGVPAVDKDGNLYGFTNRGGTYNLGTVYRLTAPQNSGGKWTKTVLYDFTSQSPGFPTSVIRGKPRSTHPSITNRVLRQAVLQGLHRCCPSA